MITRVWLLVVTGCIVFLLLALPAYAEVMDKEPTLHAIWTGALMWFVVVICASAIHPWAGVAVLLASIPFGGPFRILTEVFDPLVGPAIREEAGMGYIYQVYGANASLLFSFALGFMIWFFRRRFAKRQV